MPKYRLITPIIPTKCKYQEEGETKINEECLTEHRLNQKKIFNQNAIDILDRAILKLNPPKNEWEYAVDISTRYKSSDRAYVKMINAMKASD